jgi:hypothetical protein
MSLKYLVYGVYGGLKDGVIIIMMIFNKKEINKRSTPEMTSMTSQWQEDMWNNIQERNKVQTDPFKGVYIAFATTEKKYRLLKQKHNEIRNRIGVLQYETQDAIKAGNHGSFLEDMKLSLLSIADDLSPRTMKTFDDVKIRVELNKTIKDQHNLIVDLKSEVSIAKSELSDCRETIAKLHDEINDRNAIIETLQVRPPCASYIKLSDS